ncbi:MAG: hypothetical protein RIA69_11460 [Cyclobacteriaceae bacterium]
MKYLLVTILFATLTTKALSQYDTAQVAKLVKKVYSMQVVEDNFYDSGLFPTQRIWKGRVMEDNTFFYTASMIYILKQLQPKLSEESASKAELITSRALANVSKYANRKGEASFNFWQTDPDIPHPNGKAKYQKAKHGLPDDLDDSSIIASVLQNDSISAQVRDKMSAYAESHNHEHFRNVPKGYENTQAYRTWFADKWKQDVDFVVLCNILLFVFENDFELNKYDRASIDFIKEVVTRRDHLTRSKELSPYYGCSAVMLYHLARTISEDRLGVMQSVKSQTIADLNSLLATTQNQYERMMIYTSLYRLGANPTINISEKEIAGSNDDFYFFYATAANLSLPQYKLWIIKTLHLVPNMYWKSEAFNHMILLEFLVSTGYSLKTDFL